jgi:hypothetical protein
MTQAITRNDLGGREYPSLVQDLILRIAMFLKSRDKLHQTVYTDTGTRPKDYMPMYVKAAGVVFETARALAHLNTGKNAQKKSITGWISTLTGMSLEVSCIDDLCLDQYNPELLKTAEQFQLKEGEDMENLAPLFEEANALAGRPVDITPTTDGKFIVEWFNASHSPPPKASTRGEALRGFIEMMKTSEKLKELNTLTAEDEEDTIDVVAT